MKYHSIFLTRRDQDTGELYLDSFISYNKNEEKKQILLGHIKNNKLWKVNIKEASKMIGCDRDLAGSIHSMSFRARFNMITMHHFTTDFEFTRDDCDMYVKFANKNKDAMNKLKEARVGI